MVGGGFFGFWGFFQCGRRESVFGLGAFDFQWLHLSLIGGI